MTARKAVTGAQVFEVGGPDNRRKAEELAGKIREVLAGKEGVRVTCPIPTAELRIRDLCESTEEGDVKEAVASAGGCAPDLVKVGLIRFAGRGLGTAWVRCPLTAANKLVAARKLRIGWTNSRVEALERRPLQCYRCMGKGHTKSQCPSPIDRGGNCYRCGRSGHAARDCTAPVRCPVCADLDRPANHRAGSRACTAPRRKASGQVIKPIPPASPPNTEGGKKGEEMQDSTPSVQGGGAMEWEPPYLRGGHE